MDSVIVPVLQSLGIAGAIIAVLMAVIGTLSGVIAYMYKQANKIYGYRLGERDTLNKTLSDATATLAALVKTLEERNDISEEQADLIAAQSQSFDMLKVTMLHQLEHIKESNSATAVVIAAISEAQRTLNSMVMDNRHATANYVQEVKNFIAACNNELRIEVRGRN